MTNEAERPAVQEDRDERVMTHVHTYNTLAKVADRHQHEILGVSGPARRDGRSHVHRLRIRTSYVDAHWHWFDVMSGPAMEMPGGGHTHYYCGNTSFDDEHCHEAEGILGLTMTEDEDDCPDMPKPPEEYCKYKKKRPE